MEQPFSFMIYRNVYKSFSTGSRQLQRFNLRNCPDEIPLAFVLTIVNAAMMKDF
jgi:hypothetical protein